MEVLITEEILLKSTCWWWLCYKLRTLDRPKENVIKYQKYKTLQRVFEKVTSTRFLYVQLLLYRSFKIVNTASNLKEFGVKLQHVYQIKKKTLK